MAQFLKHESVNPDRHTRHTFAGNYDEQSKTLVIGVAGNHMKDSFNKAKGRQIATGRAAVIRPNLQNSGKQIIINDVVKENARDVFFNTIEKL